MLQLEDNHGAHGLRTLKEPTKPVDFYVLQKYKWFKASKPEEIYDLEDKNNRPIEKLIHRWVDVGVDKDSQKIRVYYGPEREPLKAFDTKI